jgi:hypothetical protein
MAASAQRPDDKKLAELILYISRLSEGDRFFGAVKLNKLLFYIDFLAYRSFGEAVTWQEYQALPQGPAPRHLVPVLQRMQDSGELVIREEPIYQYTLKRPIALREAEVKVFTPEEVSLIRDIIDSFRAMTATQISDISHRFLGWQLANENDTIPYSVALLVRGELTDHELSHAQWAEKRAESWHASRRVA